MPLRRRFLFAYLILTAAVFFTGARFYAAQVDQYHRAAYSELGAVAELKVAQIVQWRAERMGDARVLMHNPLFLDEVARWLTAPSPATRTRLLGVFRELQKNYQYASVALLGRDGEVLLGPDRHLHIIDSEVRQAIAHAFTTRSPQFTDLHLHPTRGISHFALVIPLFAWQEVAELPAAVLLLEIDPERYLYPLLQSWPTPSETAETLLVRREEGQVLYLNRLRHLDVAPLTLTVPITRAESPAVMAVQGWYGPVTGQDYRGVEVLAFLTPIPNSPWHIVVKEDSHEVLAGLQALLVGTVLVVVLLLTAIALLGMFLMQESERRHYQALYATQSALNAKTAESEAFFTHSPSLLLISDADGCFRRLNPAWAEQMGWDTEAMIGKPFSDFVHPDDLPATQARLATLSQQPAMLSFVNRYRHADGSYRWLEWRSVPFGGLIFAAARDITAQRAAEESLRQSEERLRLAADLSNMLVAVCDRALRYTWAYNTQIIGQQPAMILGRRDDEIIGAAGAQDILAIRREILATGKRVRQELWLEVHGVRRVFDVIFEPFFDAAGVVAGMTTVALDITERKQVEDSLRRSEEQMRIAADLIGMTIATVDRDLRYTWVYNSAVGAPGPAERLGKRDDEIFGADNAANVMALRRQVLATGQRVHGETTLLLKNGRRFFDVVYDPLFDADGNVAGMIGVGIDITERKRVEEALRHSQDQLRLQAAQIAQIVESVPTGVVLLDEGGRITLANPQAQTDLALLAGAQVGELLPPLGGYTPDALLANAASSQWLEIQTAARIYEVAVRPLRPAGNGQGWVLVLRDVTQERVIQANLQRQERLAAVGQLAAGIAHDFNNIMAVIVLHSELLLRSKQLGAQERERLDVILQQSRHAAELVQQILDFSRQAVLMRRLLALNDFLTEQVKLLRRILPENILIEYIAPAEPRGYIVYADPTRLAQVILNLATNARDAMPDGGALCLSLARLRVTPAGSPVQPELRPGDWIVLSVRDTGKGIAPEHLPRLFDPFFTTKGPGKGSGLGLSQVHGIVHQHDGRISVETQPGHGAVFTIYLPAHSGPVIAEAPPPAEMVNGHGETILVVEDEDAVRAALAETLQHWGYAVLEASNGAEALTVLALRSLNIRLVLSDVVMPVMGGPALARAMRAQGLTTPVVLLTGHPLQNEASELQDAHIYAWLTKPPAPDQLAQTVAQALAAA